MFRRSLFRLMPCLVVAACLVLPGVPSAAYAMDVQALFQRSGGSVVKITSKDAFGKPFSRGSGFYIREDLVVTNNHVVDKASKIEVSQGDEKPVLVKRIKARDVKNDLAILLVDRPGVPLPLKTTDPTVGEDVIAIGNPRGLERTVSPGIVSGLRRFEDQGLRYQITAPISPGSSGGPILDANGDVIGLATFYVLFGQNLNFAVPSLYVDRLLNGGGGGRDLNSTPRQRKRIEVTEDEDGVITIQ